MLAYAMRGISVVLTLGYLVTTVGACRVSEEQVYTPVPDIPIQEEPLELSILSSLPEIGLALQQAADAFRAEREHPPKITVQTIGDSSDYRTALKSRLLAGERLELFHLGGAADAAEFAPYLADLAFLPWAGAAVTPPLATEGRIVGIPYALRGTALIVNRAIFEAAELPLTEITGYESWSESFAALEAKIDSGALAEEYPDLAAVTTLPAQSADYLSRCTADLLLSGAFASPGEALAAPSVSFPDGPDCEAFLKTMIACSPYRQRWSGLVEVTPQQMIENGIATGRLAAILCDTGAWKRICALNPDLEDSLSLLPLYFENREQGSVFIDSPAYWALNSAAGDGAKVLAGDLLTWLYQSPGGAAFLAERFGAASAYPDKAADTGAPLHRQLYRCLDRGLSRPSLHSAAPKSWCEEIYVPQLREYLTQYDKEWSEVTQACADGWSVLRS